MSRLVAWALLASGIVFAAVGGGCFFVLGLTTHAPPPVVTGNMVTGETTAWGEFSGRLVYVHVRVTNPLPVVKSNWLGREDSHRAQEAQRRERSLQTLVTQIALRNTIAGATADAALHVRPIWRDLRQTTASNGYICIAAPIWQVAGVFGLVGGVMFLLGWRILRRAPPGHCPRCRYSLAGLPPAAPCPECGGRVARTQNVPRVAGMTMGGWCAKPEWAW